MSAQSHQSEHHNVPFPQSALNPHYCFQLLLQESSAICWYRQHERQPCQPPAFLRYTFQQFHLRNTHCIHLHSPSYLKFLPNISAPPSVYVIPQIKKSKHQRQLLSYNISVLFRQYFPACLSHTAFYHSPPIRQVSIACNLNAPGELVT